jgi:acetate kinase
MIAALGGVDVIAFTGGVGEHSAEIRDEAVDGLSFLPTRPQVLVVPAREDLEIARQTRVVLGS